ncbi:MAG: flavodoxin domain-containing protein [Actinomycetota bacterium]
MEKAILYATRYGCTEQCSNILAGYISGEVELKNLGKENVDVDKYDIVIIGGSISAGKINKEISSFCQNNLEALLNKKIGLFLCCLREGEEAEKQFRDAFPEQLIKKAVGVGYFGGRVSFKKLNFFFRKMMKKMLETDKDVSTIKEANIEEFANKINRIT